MRLAFAFGSGLIGILYLALAITPMATGKIEIRPTVVSIDKAESEGFPEARYLNVTGGYVVFSQADLKMEGREGQSRELDRLTAPVVSESLLKQWQTALEQGQPLDASRLRLLVSFNAEQVARLWPELKKRVEAGTAPARPPVRMDVVGETIPAEYMVYKPHELQGRSKDFDLKQIRWLRHERHFNSLGRFLKNLAIGLGLIGLSIAAFWYHRMVPDDVSTDVFDWSALPGAGDDTAGIDDIDLDA
jgi:hypothetical protein